MVQNIIEGYTYREVSPHVRYRNRRDNRYADRNRMYNDLNYETNRYNNYKNTERIEIPWMNSQITTLTNRSYAVRSETDKLNSEISNLNTQNTNLEFDNRTHKTTINKHGYKISQTESEYDRQQTKSKDKSTIILPLKKRETLGAKKYYSLLMFQNEEIKTETYSQKNNLTTADRNYDVHNSKIPYYVLVNQLLLYTYIAIALYISYRVMRGMIVDNIYGKLIIILLISLYPIYMFSLEIAIYDQYSLIKSMIRAEPYKPIRI